MKMPRFFPLLLAGWCALALAQAEAPRWDVEALAKVPAVFPAEPIRAEGMKAVFFAGLPYEGKPTRVFAWLGMPKVEPGR